MFADECCSLVFGVVREGPALHLQLCMQPPLRRRFGHAVLHAPRTAVQACCSALPSVVAAPAFCNCAGSMVLCGAAVLTTVPTLLHPLLYRTSISELSLHRWFIGSTWAMLFVIGGLLVLMYNLYPDRGLESWEKRWAAGR